MVKVLALDFVAIPKMGRPKMAKKGRSETLTFWKRKRPVRPAFLIELAEATLFDEWNILVLRSPHCVPLRTLMLIKGSVDSHFHLSGRHHVRTIKRTLRH